MFVFIRKAIYRWMLPAAGILPAWLLIGWSIFGSGGWQFVLVLGGAFILAVAMVVISAMMRSRRAVRAATAVGAADAVFLGIWHALIIWLGFQGPASSLLLTGVVLMLIGGFWFALWELLTSAKRGIETALREAEQMSYSPGSTPPQGSTARGPQRDEMPGTSGRGGFTASPDPKVIIVRETPHSD